MTVAELISKLRELPDDMEVYAINPKGLYRRLERIDIDDNYPDALMVAGDKE